MAKISQYPAAANLQDTDQFIIARSSTEENFSVTLQSLREKGFANTPTGTRSFILAIDSAGNVVKFLETSLRDNLYQNIVLADGATVAWDMQGKVVSSALLDTTRTALTLSLTNMGEGTHHSLFVRKQSASDLQITCSSQVYKVGNTAAANTVTLNGASNRLFKLEFNKVAGSVSIAVNVEAQGSDTLSDGDKGDISIIDGVWTIDNGAVTNAKIQSVAWSKITGLPNLVYTDQTYANPSWITSLDYSKITNVPTGGGTGTLQTVTDNGNQTDNPIILTNAAGTKQVSISLDSNGNVLFDAGTSQNFHFSGDIVAFSSMTPPASSWWSSLPVATAGTLGGIKIGTGLSIDGSGVVSVSGGVSAVWGNITGTLSSQSDLQAALNAKEGTITAGTTSQYWRGDKSWQTFNLQNLTSVGNTTNQGIVLTNTAGTKSVTVSVDTNGNVLFNAGTDQNFHFTGDVVAFSSMTPPASSWWSSLPVATAGTLGGIKIGSGLSIDGSGVVSVTGGSGGVGTVTGTGASNYIAYWNSETAITGESTLQYNPANNTLSLESIDFSVTHTATSAERRLLWDNDEGTLSIVLRGGNISAPIGSGITQLVHNAESTVLTKGTVVYAYGASGQRISVKRAVNTSDATSAQTVGVIAESIASGSEGWMVVSGTLRGLDTSSYVQGDPLYLGATAGTYSSTKPYAPNHLVYVGFIVKVHASSGEIFVRCQNGYEMDEIHDYQEVGVVDKNVISYESSSGLYKPKSISTLLGYTPEPNISSGTTSQYWRGDKSWQTFNLQNLTSVGNSTNQGIILTNTAGTKSVTVSVDTNGNVLFNAGVDQNFHFTGDVVAFSSMSPPATSWWTNMPYATATTVGGIKVGANLSIDANGVLSATGGGTGSVSSVGLSLPSIFTVTGSPVTSSGTLTATLATQSANTVFAGPSTGVAAAPTFRTLVASDIPALSYEPVISAGTTSQYWRGDKSWQTLNTTAVSEGTNLYYTDTRVRSAVLTGYAVGTNTALAATDTVLGAFQKVQGQLNAKEGTITAGTTSQYWRGDKSWQTLNTTAVAEGTNLYYTDVRARGAISLTTTGSSGASTYSSSTGVLNVPTYTLSGLGGEPAITAGTTSQYWRGDKSWQTFNLQNLTSVGNTTNQGIVLTNTAGTKSVTVSVDTNGNIIFNAGTDQNFHFSGDVVAFSSLTPPVSSWWNSLPIASATVLGGIKVGTNLTIDANGVLSATGGGSGSVTSVALSLPSMFTVTGSPVTTSGTLTATLATQTANTVFAGPSSGVASAPTFRSLVASDIPALSYEPVISAGTTSQYWRGDKSWQTLNTTAVTEGTNLYYTDARVRSAVLTGYAVGTNTALAATDTVLGAFQKVQGQLNAKANSTHTHAIADVTGLQTALDGKEPSITAGTTSQYWRGDKSWQTLNTTAVTEGTNLYYTDARARAAISLTTTGSSGASTYSSSTGVLNVPTYTLAGLGGEPSITAGTTSQYWRGDKSWQTLNTTAVTEGTNLYYTDARVRSAVLTGYAVGTNTALAATDTVLGAFQKVQGQLNAKEGTITAGTTSQYWRGDKSWQTLNTTAVTEGTNLYYTDARARAAISLTTTGSSGASTYSSSTGVLNVPTYTLAGLGGEPSITAGTTSQYWRGDKSWQTFNLQNLTSVGNSTNQGIVLTNTAGTKSVTVSVDTNGNILFNAGTDQNFHFSGDVVAFSSMTPPVSSWWNSLPIASATVLGGIKVGANLSIDVNGVLSATGGGTGTVSSVALSLPSIFTVTGSPVTSSGTLTATLATQTANTVFAGPSTGVASAPTFRSLVAADIPALSYEPVIASGTTSQYWRGDKSWQTLNTTAVTEGTNLYYTDARARASISLTTTGSSGASTYSSSTGVLNVPTYTLSGLGGEPSIAAGTTAQYWRGDKSWQTLNTTAVAEGTNLYYTDTRVRSAVLTGYAVGTNTALAATDSVLGAFQKVQGQLNAKANSTHTHAISDVTGLQTALDGKEATITAGTTAQYWRGDKSWQTLNTTAVAEGTNLYYTDARVIAAALTGYVVGTNTALAATDTILGAFQKVQGQLNAKASSSHTHSISEVTGLQAALDAKEPSITAGTTAQYWRGDKSWQTLNTTAVAEGTNAYYTDARVRSAALTGYVVGTNTAIAATDGVLGAFQKVQGQINAREATITAGTTAQYWRGDKSWQTLNTTAVAEGTNLYYTDARARASLSFTAGSGGYNSSTGVITIPTNNNQLTNGAGYITSSASITGSAGSAERIIYNDGPRDLTNRLPNSFTRTVNFDFVNSGTVGGTGNYAGVMTYNPWDGTTASTGDSSYQLAFLNESGSNGSGLPGLRIRKGIDTTWGTWYTLLHAGNYSSYSPTLTGGGASGTWGISISGNAATATSATTATNWGSYGAVPAAGTSFANANTIGRSDANGYTYFNYINSNTTNGENPTVGQIIVTNGTDNFYRKATIGHLTSAVQSSASGTWGISVSGSAASATTAGSVTNSFTIRGDSGTTEGTDIFTFNGSASKSINFIGGSNITITKVSGQFTFAATGLLPTPRTTTTAFTATLTPNVSTGDVFTITGQNGPITMAAPTGSPYNGQKIIIRIKDVGSAVAITWTTGSNGSYRASSDLSLPITTIASRTLYLGFMYNSTDLRWDLIAKLDNFA